MEEKKRLLLSIGLVLILVLMIVGISYATFKFVGLGKKENTITTGAITMEYEESTNTISMTGALPTTDATGKVRLTAGEYFDFTIKSNIQGNANINWEIAAEDITPSSAKKMAGKNIKLYLTKLNGDKEEEVMAPKVYSATTSANTKTGRPSGVMSLATGTMSTSETTNYRLRMYVDEDYNPQGDGGGLSFSVKINAYGKVKEAPTGSKMKAYMTQADYDNDNYPKTDFHTADYAPKITSIITKKDNIVPETATESWDISEAGDGSVMAYVEDDGTGNSTYKLTIGGKGGIIANESMIEYFAAFYKMTSIDLSDLDTSEVTNMSSMFEDCGSLTSLDVSNFDTSKVTNMISMFAYCSSLTSLDVSNFNAPELTNITDMFSELTNLETLNLSNFNAPKITNMDGMFKDLSKLSKLDLTNFNTVNVTSMSEMFNNCSSLTNLDLSSFDTTNVTNMSTMFAYCSSLTNLDVSNFNAPKLTDITDMFKGLTNLETLNLSNFNAPKITNMDAMFKDLSKLSKLNLTNFNTANVTSMREMFSGCSSLTNLDLSSFDISRVTNMVCMFSDCPAWNTVDQKKFSAGGICAM